ncbi:adenosine deaminase [Olsenella sp. Marseille-QA0557]|uniref:adenosine deaminase n=1 Tax=Olsenella sp. Marseille-QA0557 TaxID=3378782 RepID=UPI003D0FA34F
MSYVDLHLHLDGAITPAIARELARMQDIVLPDEVPGELEQALSVGEKCESLNDYLACFDLPISLLQTHESIREAVRLVQEMLISQDCLYAEIRFAPQQFVQSGLSQEEVVQAALEGLSLSPMRCNLILCCMRGTDTAEKNIETVRLAEQYLCEDGGVVGLDLAGAEALFPTKDYVDLLRGAHERGVPLTVHAGEAAGPESIWSALQTGCTRIGHGIHAVSDPSLMHYLAEHAVVLEVCPTSNFHTHAVEEGSNYPLRALLDAGVHVTIATDDMAISRTCLAHEVDYAKQLAHLSEEECLQLQLTAIQAAFTSEATKQELRELLQRKDAVHAD